MTVRSVAMIVTPTTSERKKQSQFGKWRSLADNATQQALTSEASRALVHFRYMVDLAPPPPALPSALLEEEGTCAACAAHRQPKAAAGRGALLCGGAASRSEKIAVPVPGL